MQMSMHSDWLNKLWHVSIQQWITVEWQKRNENLLCILDIESSPRHIVQLKKPGEEHLYCATFCRKTKTYKPISIYNHKRRPKKWTTVIGERSSQIGYRNERKLFTLHFFVFFLTTWMYSLVKKKKLNI